MSTSVSVNDVDFSVNVGDVVGVRILISGYGSKQWKLIEADWYGDEIPGSESHSNSYDNKVWRHAGKAEITKITATRVEFEVIG